MSDEARMALYRDLIGVLEATGVFVTDHMEELVGNLVDTVDIMLTEQAE